jgi:hypothetical protein
VAKDKMNFKKKIVGNTVKYQTNLKIDQIIELFKQNKIENHADNIAKYNKLRRLKKA